MIDRGCVFDPLSIELHFLKVLQLGGHFGSAMGANSERRYDIIQPFISHASPIGSSDLPLSGMYGAGPNSGAMVSHSQPSSLLSWMMDFHQEVKSASHG
jgi:hypothetical protein